MKKLVAGAAGLAIVGAAFFFFAPIHLGGSVSYTVLTGSSMEPGLQADDLVIVRESSGYEPGDVVAYRSPSLGRVVLHRIVRRQDDRFVLQGDNNTWLDTDKPQQSEVIGKLWLRAPGAGRLLMALQHPRNAALLVAIFTLLVFGSGNKRERRHDADPAGDDSGTFTPGEPLPGEQT